jgi:hypothetical protein
MAWVPCPRRGGTNHSFSLACHPDRSDPNIFPRAVVWRVGSRSAVFATRVPHRDPGNQRYPTAIDENVS